MRGFLLVAIAFAIAVGAPANPSSADAAQEASPAKTAATTAGEASSTTATAPTGACSRAEFRQFDFWLGSWDVANAKGEPAGRNQISVEEQGCAILERWQSARGGTGMSLNYYDPRLGQWRQHWVGLGIVLEMAGGWRDGVMVLEGPLHYLRDGRTTRLRGEWTPLPDGRVRQHFQESTDNGRSWTDWFDGYYRRASAGAKPHDLP